MLKLKILSTEVIVLKLTIYIYIICLFSPICKVFENIFKK